MSAHYRGDTKWTGQVTPTAVMALMKFQGGLCAVSGVRLVIPDFMRKKELLTGWIQRSRMSDQDAACVPVIMPAVMANPDMVPGNILLIARCWVQPYRLLGGAAGLARAARGFRDTVVPTGELLSRDASEIIRESVQEIRVRLEQQHED